MFLKLKILLFSIIFFSIPVALLYAAGCCKSLNSASFGSCLPQYTTAEACVPSASLIPVTRYWVANGICNSQNQCVEGNQPAANQQQINTTPPLKINLQIPLPIPGFPQELPITGDTLGQYIAALYRFFVGALGIIAVVVMMIGGFQWIVSAGSSERISRAKSTIFNAIIGLILAITSYLILYVLNPSLVNFGSLTIEPITPVFNYCYNGQGSCLVSCPADYTEKTEYSNECTDSKICCVRYLGSCQTPPPNGLGGFCRPTPQGCNENETINPNGYCGGDPGIATCCVPNN